MTRLEPLETLYEASAGEELPLPEELLALYGPLRLPLRRERAHVVGNFVSTIDGVVALGGGVGSGGSEISGHNEHDRMVMGLLRAAADAVILGAGTLRSVPGHLWTAPYIYPMLAGAYSRLRAASNKPALPMNVVVTARGEVDLDLPVFSGLVPVLVVTTNAGRDELRRRGIPEPVRVVSVNGGARLRARAVLEAVGHANGGGLILVEGGPHLMGDFLSEGCLDELFLTLAPQVAGRDAADRPGLVAGVSLAPDRPAWGRLAGVKRAASHLFLRYAFPGDSHG